MIKRFYSCVPIKVGYSRHFFAERLDYTCPYCHRDRSFYTISDARGEYYAGCTKCQWVMMYDGLDRKRCGVNGNKGIKYVTKINNRTDLTKMLNEAALKDSLDKAIRCKNNATFL